MDLDIHTGKGYADLVFFLRKHSDKPVMIVELKSDHSAQSAIDQIKNKQHPTSLKNWDRKKQFLLIGISYDRKTIEYICRIEEN